MKIIISPSKTTTLQNSVYLEDKKLLFPKQHKKVLAQLRKLNKTALGKALNIKGDILNNTYSNIKNYNNLDSYHAFPSFSGLVFFNLDKKSYLIDEYNYIDNHLRILDALYGVLEPGTLIKPYRLDMKAKLEINLYKHWNINDYFKDELVINLASTEFSKMVNQPMININFLQKKNDKFINQATYSKMARGLFLDYLIKNKIENVSEMKLFSFDNYQFNPEHSDEFNLTFTR